MIHPVIYNETVTPKQVLFRIRGRQGEYLFDLDAGLTYNILTKKPVRSTIGVTPEGKRVTVRLDGKSLLKLFYGGHRPVIVPLDYLAPDPASQPTPVLF